MLLKLSTKKLKKKLGLIFKTCIFLYLSILNYSYSQTINGVIENIYGEKILIANIVIKDSITSNDIKEFTIGRNGKYKISLTNNYSNLIIVANAPKYISDTIIIRNPNKSESYTRNIILQKDTVLILKEVTIVAKSPAFTIKKDTLNYNVASYSDGTERKIVDIIKKLPGIDVNEKTGEILYKGKSIETVRLEGEDLFGSNYSIGTKNINVDIVEQVQAIENYSDNPLLKGIEAGDKVALNLKLKKEKLDFSGSIDLGLGIADQKNATSYTSANILGVSKKYKSFGTVSYNNVGVNNSPFDYFSPNSTVDQLKDSEYYSKKLIPEMTFYSGLDNLRINSNNEFFINYNNAFKIGKRWNAKANLYYLNDKIHFNQDSRNYNIINGNQIITSDNYSIIKKPTQYRGELEIKSKFSELTLIEYRLKASNEQVSSSNNIIQNDTINYKSSLNSLSYFIKQSFVITRKLSNKKALQLFINHSWNDIPQNYSISLFPLDSTTNNPVNQHSDFKKNILSIRSIMLAKPSANSRYSVSIGGYIEGNNLNTKLSNEDTFSNQYTSFFNQLYYQKKAIEVFIKYEISTKKWKFITNPFLSYLSQTYNNILSNKYFRKESLLIEPNLTSTYSIDNKSFIVTSVNYTQKPLVDDYLYSNYILQSNRVIIKNIPSLNFQKNTSLSLFYLNNDLYRQFRMNAGANYIISRGNYFSNISLNKTTTQISQFYLLEPISNMSFNYLIERYMALLHSTFRIKSNYSIFKYRNQCRLVKV